MTPNSTIDTACPSRGCHGTIVSPDVVPAGTVGRCDTCGEPYVARLMRHGMAYAWDRKVAKLPRGFTGSRSAVVGPAYVCCPVVACQRPWITSRLKGLQHHVDTYHPGAGEVRIVDGRAVLVPSLEFGKLPAKLWIGGAA